MANQNTTKPKKQQTYGDLLLGLKNDSGIYPTDTNYSDCVKEWIEKNIFHNQVCDIMIMSEDGVTVIKSWIDNFSDNFKRKSRDIWKSSGRKIYYGQSATIDSWLKKTIPIYYTCNCSVCISETEPMEIDAEESKGQSKS